MKTEQEQRTGPVDATGPVANGDLLGGGSRNHHKPLLPPMPREVAEQLAAMEPTEIARQVRILVHGYGARDGVRTALRRLQQLVDTAPLDILLAEMRAEFTAAADGVKSVIG